jgi:Ca2+-binding EF-hand superfamily protein
MKTLQKHSRMWIVALAAVAGMAATNAFANDKDMGSGDMMSAVDTNHDGMISSAEHAAHAKAMFDKMDTNHDGMVNKAEMEAGMKMMHDRMGRDDHMQHGAMDQDHDAMQHETTPTK